MSVLREHRFLHSIEKAAQKRIAPIGEMCIYGFYETVDIERLTYAVIIRGVICNKQVIILFFSYLIDGKPAPGDLRISAVPHSRVGLIQIDKRVEILFLQRGFFLLPIFRDGHAQSIHLFRESRRKPVGERRSELRVSVVQECVRDNACVAFRIIGINPVIFPEYIAYGSRAGKDIHYSLAAFYIRFKVFLYKFVQIVFASLIVQHCVIIHQQTPHCLLYYTHRKKSITNKKIVRFYCNTATFRRFLLCVLPARLWKPSLLRPAVHPVLFSGSTAKIVKNNAIFYAAKAY